MGEAPKPDEDNIQFYVRAETENIPGPVRAEIHSYYDELKLGSPRAVALMDSIREVDLSVLIEGAESSFNRERDKDKKTHYQTELNQHVAQMAERRERILDRIETIDGYASEYQKANDLISKLRESVAGPFEPSHMNVSDVVSEFFTVEIIHPMLGVGMVDVTAP